MTAARKSVTKKKAGGGMRADTSSKANCQGADLPFPTVAIIGSGFGGLGMAIALKKAGIESFTIFEKDQRVGGTWRDNTYPGAACDVPSHLYSYSFEPKTDWSRAFPLQAEILGYIEHCVAKYELTPRIRFGSPIAVARFDETADLWRLRTEDGAEHLAHILISGTGQLNRPAYPDIPGVEKFEGTAFHSARWDHDHSLTGERVAVIGTGASAIQFVAPVAERAGRLQLFQRTPPYILPKPDRPFSDVEKLLFRRMPGYRELQRQIIYWGLESRFLALKPGSRTARWARRTALKHLRAQVADPALRRTLTPDYEVGCKRILISNDYYPALCRPNVEIVTDRIERITKSGIVTHDGTQYEVDTIIFGTGFESTDFLAPMEMVGRRGLTLDEAWKDGAEAYYGITVAGFPNLFLLYGPNTNLGHNSIIFMMECQVRYILQCIAHMCRNTLASIEPRAEVFRSYNDRIQERLSGMVWNTGCSSWYKNEAGKITNNWPGPTMEYRLRTRRVDFSDYHSSPRQPSKIAA